MGPEHIHEPKLIFRSNMYKQPIPQSMIFFIYSIERLSSLWLLLYEGFSRIIVMATKMKLNIPYPFIVLLVDEWLILS